MLDRHLSPSAGQALPPPPPLRPPEAFVMAAACCCVGVVTCACRQRILLNLCQAAHSCALA